MRRFSLGLLATVLWVLAHSSAWAVILASGNGNTTADSLNTAGGPGGSATVPGFVNVGAGSTGQSSVVYLGNRWALTASHVTINGATDSIQLSNGFYTAIPASIVTLTNPDNSLTDLKLFQLTTDPGLPAFSAAQIGSSSPAGGSRVFLAGNGMDTGATLFWHVENDGTWLEPVTPPVAPGPMDFKGVALAGGGTVRWGDNSVYQHGLQELTTGALTQGFTTRFDDLLYTLENPLTFEAHGSQGDSGGAVFDEAGNLVGIISAVSMARPGQPGGTALFGDETFIMDLSFYREQILAIVPEPGGVTLALVGLAGLGLFVRRGRRVRR